MLLLACNVASTYNLAAYEECSKNPKVLVDDISFVESGGDFAAAR
jgi:hypothetical protein